MAQQGEKRMLNEWLTEVHRTHLTMRNVRLGRAVNQEEAARESVLLRWVDAVVIDNDTIYLIEAKIRASPGAVGQLENYGRLFRETPEFSQHQNKTVRLVLLSGQEDMATRAMCEEKGIEFVRYLKEWMVS